MKNILTEDRRKRLTQIINSSGSIKIGEIASVFGVSTETIRKDLIYLNDQGIVKKSHGGAIAINENMTVDARSMENFDLKTRIAMKALEYIKSNNAIMIDSGSTTLAFATMIPKNNNLTIITNSFAAANVLIGYGNNIYFIGGELSETTMATSGLWATHSLDTVKCDVLFLGSSGFQSHHGPCAKMFLDAQIKMEMIKNSQTRIVLADSSKFHSNAIVQYAKWSEIDVLITDENAPTEHVKHIAKTTEVILV